MRICYLSNNDMPSKMANSIQTIKMCEAFTYNDHNVLLICPNSQKIKTSIFKFYDVRKKFQIMRLQRYKKFPLGFKYYLFSLESILRSLQFKPDIYITRNFFTSMLLCLMKKKNILELHHSLSIESRIVRFIVYKTKFFKSKYLIKFIAITNTAKKYYLKFLDKNDQRILVLPSGSSLIRKVNSINKIKKYFDIGIFGSIFKWDLNLLFKLIEIDSKNNYHIYGDRNDHIFKIKNRKHNLKFKGYIEYRNIKDELDKMDILLMPYAKIIATGGNLGDITNFTSPLKMFDYLTAGKVIISSDLPVLREILINHKNVIYIKNFSNVNAWKLELIKIFNKKSKQIIISKNNIKLSKNFTLNKRAEKILENL